MVMTDITDGIAMQNIPQMDIPHLLFSVYSDELENVNPIGMHRKTQSDCALLDTYKYTSIPVEFRSKMHVIQLAAIAKLKDVKEFGGDALLDDLCDAFIQLKNGMVLGIAEYGKLKYTGSLSFVLADTLAAHFG